MLEPKTTPALGGDKKEEIEMSEIINQEKNEVIEEQKNEVIEEQKNEVIEEQKNVNPKGKVVNCKLLNVRKKGNINADIIEVINEGDEVEILTNLNKQLEFYRVRIPSGKIGFCMSKYIEIES